MDRPIHVAALLVGFWWTTAGVVAQDESVAPKRPRAISPHVAEMLTQAAVAKTPSSEVKAETAPEPANGVAPVGRERVSADPIRPTNGIVRLPDYVVRERRPPKLPEPEDVMTPRALEKYALQTFLGDETGLERALSMLTPAHVWRMIPILGKVPFVGFETNEQRAVRLYRADREAREWAEALGMLTPEQRAAIATPTGAAPVKK